MNTELLKITLEELTKLETQLASLRKKLAVCSLDVARSDRSENNSDKAAPLRLCEQQSDES